MDPVARKLQAWKAYQLHTGKDLQGKPLTAAAKGNLQRDTQQYNQEWGTREGYGYTDKKVTQQYQLKHKAKQQANAAYIQARKAGKSEAEAKQLGAAAAKKTVSGHIAPDWGAKADIFLRGKGSRGYGRAQDTAKFSEYLKEQRARGNVTASAVADKQKQQLKETSTNYNVAKKMFPTRGSWLGDAVESKADKKVAAAGKDFENQYSTKIKTAPQDVMKQRGAAWNKAGGWLKNNWGKVAGLGMGALGLMALWRMGSNMGQQRPMQQMQQRMPQQQMYPMSARPEWAQERSRGFGAYGSAGNQQQTRLGMGGMPRQGFSSIFKNFMGGRR
jgi:hypothetical protein